MVATRDQMNAVRRMFERMKMRVFNLVSRATISTSTTGVRGATVGIKALQGDDRDGAEYFEPYGIAGAVPVGAEGVALAIGGSNDQVIVVCASDKGGTPEGRLPGEVDIYSQHGQRIRLHADGSISLLQGSAGTVYLGTDVNPAAPAANRAGAPGHFPRSCGTPTWRIRSSRRKSWTRPSRAPGRPWERET